MEHAPDSPAVSTAAPAASFEAELNPLAQPEQALVPVAPDPSSSPADDDDDEGEPPFDAHGFDPADYKWVPVRRKPRKDGWTPQRQQDFIAALADSGCVEHAALKVRMSVTSCYRLRRSPGAENFAAAWDVALQHAARQLLDLAFDRAVRGTDEPVFDREGRRVGRRFRQNDRLMMFLLRAYMPERFRHAHRDGRAPGESLPPPAPPMADMLRRLEPVLPPEPHRLLPPEELEVELQVADVGTGELPHWYRGRGDAEPPFVPHPELEAELERLLDGEAGDKGDEPILA